MQPDKIIYPEAIGYKLLRIEEGRLLPLSCRETTWMEYSASDWTYADSGPLFVFTQYQHARFVAGSTTLGPPIIVACVTYIPIKTRITSILAMSPTTQEASTEFWTSLQNTGTFPLKSNHVALAAAISIPAPPRYLQKNRLHNIFRRYADITQYPNMLD